MPSQRGGPAPTLLLLASGARQTLTTEPYCHVGVLLHREGWNVLSMDPPCHGADEREGEPAGLEGWAWRVAAGEDVGATFARQAAEVINYVVHEGLADPDRLTAAGTSRGGYMAFRAAAGCPTIRAVAGFAPVTDPGVLTEFREIAGDPRVEAMGLERSCESLADRAVWLTIGSQDDRVGTDRAIDFALGVTAACRRKRIPSQVELHVLPEPGHVSKTEWYSDAASWLRRVSEPTAPRSR